MGTEINLKGAGFNRVLWRRKLGNVVYSASEGPVAQLCLSVLHPSEADLILFDDEEVRAASRDAEVWLLPLGGIRGITIKHERDGIVLSLPLLVGSRDWEMAAALTKLALECGATVDIDGQNIVAASGPLDFSLFAAQSWEQDVATLKTIVTQGRQTALPILSDVLHLDLSTDDIDSPDLHADLVARMERFGAAHFASTLTAQTPAGHIMNLNVAGGVPTLIERSAHGLILHDQPTSRAAISEPLFGGNPVPTGTFLQVMGSRLESAGPRVYVPLFTYSDEPDIFAALQTAAAGGTVEGSAVDTSLESLAIDHHALARGPVLVFLMVAGADGKVDQKEILTFQALLANNGMAPGEVFQGMLKNAIASFQQIFEELTAESSTSVAQILADLVEALNACPPEESLFARQGLYTLGHAIASVSRGFLGIGPRISRSEKRVLAMLQGMLRVDPKEIITK